MNKEEQEERKGNMRSRIADVANARARTPRATRTSLRTTMVTKTNGGNEDDIHKEENKDDEDDKDAKVLRQHMHVRGRCESSS